MSSSIQQGSRAVVIGNRPRPRSVSIGKVFVGGGNRQDRIEVYVTATTATEPPRPEIAIYVSKYRGRRKVADRSIGMTPKDARRVADLILEATVAYGGGQTNAGKRRVITEAPADWLQRIGKTR